MLNVIRKGNLMPLPSLLVALMQTQFDDKVKAYITEHPRASVVNIGAGLDTTFYRVDNGLIHWYDCDGLKHPLQHAASGKGAQSEEKGISKDMRIRRSADSFEIDESHPGASLGSILLNVYQYDSNVARLK